MNIDFCKKMNFATQWSLQACWQAAMVIIVFIVLCDKKYTLQWQKCMLIVSGVNNVATSITIFFEFYRQLAYAVVYYLSLWHLCICVYKIFLSIFSSNKNLYQNTFPQMMPELPGTWFMSSNKEKAWANFTITDQDNIRLVDEIIALTGFPFLFWSFYVTITTAFDKFCKTKIQNTRKILKKSKTQESNTYGNRKGHH